MPSSELFCGGGGGGLRQREVRIIIRVCVGGGGGGGGLKRREVLCTHATTVHDESVKGSIPPLPLSPPQGS